MRDASLRVAECGAPSTLTFCDKSLSVTMLAPLTFTAPNSVLPLTLLAPVTRASLNLLSRALLVPET